MPDAIQNAPDLLPGLELFWSGFQDLASCRSQGYGVPGPIPWTAIHTYCEAHGIEGRQREDMFYHVERLDKVYLDWSAKRFKTHMNSLKPASPPPAKGSKP